MTLIVVNQGEEDFLDHYFAIANLGGGNDLHLFTNEVTAGLTAEQIDALTAVDFDEATFAGYASVNLSAGSWVVTQGNPTTATFAEQSFTRSSSGTAENVWGYYVTLTTDGSLQWFEEFSGPIVVEFVDDEIQVTPRLTLDDSGGSEVPIGVVEEFAGSTLPANYLWCDGSAVSRSTYSLLFAEIGETYGAGDGSLTFNLPDRRGRFGLGKADAGTGSALGETGGAIDHVHGLDTASSHAKVNVSTSNVPYQAQKTGLPQWTATREGSGSGGNSTATTTSGTELAGDSDTANPPYLALNCIIKAL